jgi:hypothetical protein
VAVVLSGRARRPWAGSRALARSCGNLSQAWANCGDGTARAADAGLFTEQRLCGGFRRRVVEPMPNDNQCIASPSQKALISWQWDLNELNDAQEATCRCPNSYSMKLSNVKM